MHATYTHALLVGFATNVWPICDHQNNIFHSTIYFMAFPLFFKIYTVCVVLHPLFLDFPDCEDPITIRGSSCSFLPVCCLQDLINLRSHGGQIYGRPDRSNGLLKKTPASRKTLQKHTESNEICMKHNESRNKTPKSHKTQ